MAAPGSFTMANNLPGKSKQTSKRVHKFATNNNNNQQNERGAAGAEWQLSHTTGNVLLLLEQNRIKTTHFCAAFARSFL